MSKYLTLAIPERVIGGIDRTTQAQQIYSRKKLKNALSSKMAKPEGINSENSL